MTTSTHPRFPTRLRFLERPVREDRRADRSVNNLPPSDPFADPPPFTSATTQANARSYGGGHLSSYATTVSTAFHLQSALRLIISRVQGGTLAEVSAGRCPRTGERHLWTMCVARRHLTSWSVDYMLRFGKSSWMNTALRRLSKVGRLARER